MIHFLLFVIGLTGLWLGTNWVVRSALGIAAKFNLSHAFVGLGILAVGTDLPEFFVTIKASLLQLNGIESSGIITGNAIGSSISQITIILGIAGLFMNLSLSKKDWLRDGIALLTSILVLMFVGWDGEISKLDGFVLLGLYVVYYIILLKTKTATIVEINPNDQLSNFKLSAYLTLGFIALLYSSHLVVDNALFFAKNWGFEQSFVGIVFVGLGTSLPELAVSVGAAMKKSAGISVGNIIGSNVFDTFIPIGMGGAISQVSMDHKLILFDLPFLFFVTIFTLYFLKSNEGINKVKSISLIISYLGYISLKLMFSL